MIPNTNRINREDFENIMKKGGFSNSGLFSLRFLKNVENKGLSGWRISVVVSKKIAKTAVSRNKIRRRAYSILRKYLKNLKSPYFIAFFAKKGVEKATFQEFQTDIEKLLEKAKIL